MNQVIKVENLSFTYQDLPVLDNVSFEVFSGEFVGIIGPNGGGKTTLLKILMDIIKPASGRVLLFGESPRAVLKKIAYVPQVLRCDKQFPISVLEVVLSGRLSHLPWYGRFSTQDKKIAIDILDQMGLAQFQHRPFGMLSGGQAQRVLIARALASHPSLLLLDEPTASVDMQAEADIYALLKELKGKITILMVTHDLRIAMEHVQRVLCVQHQVISLQPKEVCAHYAFGLYHSPMIQQ